MHVSDSIAFSFVFAAHVSDSQGFVNSCFGISGLRHSPGVDITSFGLVPNMKNSVAGLGVIQGNVLEVLAGKTGLDASAPYQVAEAGLGAPILG